MAQLFMSTVAHFFMIKVAQKFVITWLTFSLTFTCFLIHYRNRIMDKDRCEMKDASFSITFFHGVSHTDRWRQIWYSKLINAKEGRS